MRIQFPLIPVFVSMLFCSETLAFTIDKKVLTAGTIEGISLILGNREVFELNGGNPIIRIGESSAKCFRTSGANWREWDCLVPLTKSSGLQKLYLINPKNNLPISSVDVELTDRMASYIVFSVPNKDTIIPKKLGLERWMNSLISNPINTLLVQNIDFNIKFTYSKDVIDKLYPRSISMTPETAFLFRERAGRDIINTIDIPNECIYELTSVTPREYNPWEATKYYGSNTAIVTPTRDPDVGGGDKTLFPQAWPRYVSKETAQRFNGAMRNLVGLPKIPPNTEADKNIRIYVIDTYDSKTNFDAFNYKVSGHGKVVFEIIQSISSLSNNEILGINACNTPEGTCNTVKILSALCKAAYESKILNKRVLVNMSLAAPSGGSSLKDVLRFALESGVTIVAANGNLDLCTNLKKGEICHQYPADWSNGLDEYLINPTNDSGRIISVGALEIGKNLQYLKIAPFDRFGSKLANSEYLPTLYAPGGFYHKDADGRWIYRFGTSFAAPYVTGVLAAWMRSKDTSHRKHPCDLEKMNRELGIQTLFYPSSNCPNTYW